MEKHTGTSTIPVDTDPSKVSIRRANEVVDSMFVDPSGASSGPEANIQRGDDHSRRIHD